jgi:neutral ceramidase
VRLRSAFRCVSVALFAAVFLAPSFVSAAELKAGVAVVDITPPLALKPPLGGYGARMNKPATGVHDRIFAKAIVLVDEATKRKFALVTADMLGFPPPVKPAVLDKLAAKGWSAENVILLPSHSHTSIEMNAINPLNTYQVPQLGIHNPQLYDLTVNNFVRVIEEAEKVLVPVKFGTTSIKIENWNRNRRLPGGPVDPELTITRIDTNFADTEPKPTRLDKPLAILVNWTAHPTFMSEDDMQFSGDWPGHLQRTLESLIGQGVVAMYYNGAEGDQSTISRENSGDSHWERAERYGRDLGIVAYQQWMKTTTKADVPFAFHLHEYDLPERKWHPNFKETGGTEYGLTEELLTEMLPRMFPARTASVSLRVGDLVVIGISGELGVQLGLKIKDEARKITGATNPTIGGLADEWLSYILTDEQYKMGQYEASVSFYGPTLGKTVVDAAVAGVKELTRSAKPN